MSLAGRKRRQSLRLICEINVTAFLSVQVALLTMLMAVPMLYRDLPMGPSTDLAKVAHPVPMKAANREDAMIVAVMRTGDVWLGNQKLAPKSLPPAILEGVRRGAERKVYIRADMRAKYGRVREVLDEVRLSEIENIAFLVDQRNPPYPAP